MVSAVAVQPTPSRRDEDRDPRPRLERELEPLAGLVRRIVGGAPVAVVVPADVLRALTGDEGSPLELAPALTIVADGPRAWEGIVLSSTDGRGIATGPPVGTLRPEALAELQALASIATAAVATVAELVTANARVRELRELSEIDPLTGLGNRRHLDRVLPYEIGRRRRYERALTLVMLDLDRFKRINDGHGHDGGDAVLREMGGVLRSALRAADVAVRYGGEEFAVILPETPGEYAAVVTERIRRQTEALDVGGIRITTSIGVASVEGRWEGDAAALIRAADQALYRAKREGRNRVVHADVAEGSIDSSPRQDLPRLRRTP
jgi:diguanylate cyclase (GGDEF)-like protein